MEEKRYPILEEEESIGMVYEPAAVALATDPKSAGGITTVHDWIDDLDWDKFPSFGPSSEEEALSRIDRFEEELKKGQVKWVSSEQAWAQLYERFPWLR